MQTAELQFVLRNCFAIDEMRRILRTVSPSEDPYEAAVEAILNEDEDGLSVLDELDRASLKQRRKVRSMSAKELRSGVAFEFMERGRTLAHTVWALMRDDRIAAKTMADSLVQQFDEPEDDQSDSAESEMIDVPIAVSELLSDITAPEEPEIDLSHPHPEEPEVEPEPEVPQKNAQDILSEEEISREVDSLIDSLKDDPSLELIEEDDDDGDIVLDSFDLEDDETETILDVSEEDDDSEGLSFSDIDLEALNQEVVDEITPEAEDESDLSFDIMGEAVSDDDEDDDVIHTLEDVDSLIASFQEHEISQADDSEFEIDATDSDSPLEFDSSVSVELGGVPIPLSALQQACERVFQEPVELVIDETLTRDDKIVVVGKQCGVRVLQGPSCAITAPDEDFVPSDAPVIVSPASLQSALSTIHGENIEIVPDAQLLSRGIVVFAGQTIGIGMYEHPRMQVLVDEDGAAAEPTATSQEAVELQNRIQLLEERLSALEAAPPVMAEPVAAAPTPISEPEIETEPEPAPEPEPEESLSKETISLDEIESEELSPVTEDIDEDDLMAAIALQGDDDEDDDIGLSDLGEIEEDVAVDAEEEPEDDALDLGALEDLVDGEGDETDAAPEEETASDETEEELDLDSLDLGELDLDADVEEESPDEATTETAETEPTESEEEDVSLDDLGDLDLDSLGDDSLTDDALSELGLGEDSKDGEESLEFDESELGDLDLDMGDEDGEGDEEDDSAIGDALDLDVLSELDEGGEDDFTPHKVFNGEKILLLGGESDHSEDYQRIVQEVGGAAEWHGELNGMSPEEITELVDQCDLILTLSGDALSDPGILQAVNYAQENNKRLFEHHSANPVSVQKQLVKLVEDGKV
ncbi:MAG: hypothetical protein P9L94_01725 [Candidatus Hinthialibacter antarcticus]|nr:hypothetical protein [Candidatus Hinthialibacter antarcticus]